MSEDSCEYMVLPEDLVTERVIDAQSRTPPLIRMDQRAAITNADFRRMRTIAINLAAWVEGHCDGNEALRAQIVELRGIINAPLTAPPPPRRSAT